MSISTVEMGIRLCMPIRKDPNIDNMYHVPRRELTESITYEKAIIKIIFVGTQHQTNATVPYVVATTQQARKSREVNIVRNSNDISASTTSTNVTKKIPIQNKQSSKDIDYGNSMINKQRHPTYDIPEQKSRDGRDSNDIFHFERHSNGL